MAKVVWASMIQSVSGALNKINKKSPHAGDQQMVLATHRKAATTSTDCNRIYLRGLSSVSRSTDPTARELQIRTRFSTISAQIAAKRRDPVDMQAIQTAFMAQKDDPNGYKTLTKYLWATLGDAYDQAHPQG